MVKEHKGRGTFRTISLPSQLVEAVERVVKEFEYWPTKTDFVREAVLEKLEKYGRDLKDRTPQMLQEAEET